MQGKHWTRKLKLTDYFINRLHLHKRNDIGIVKLKIKYKANTGYEN